MLFSWRMFQTTGDGKYLDNIDDEEYDASEEYDLEDEEYRWENMPQEIVRRRPFKPQGKFRRFTPPEIENE